jgi:sugar lactone lactonase YvrE
MSPAEFNRRQFTLATVAACGAACTSVCTTVCTTGCVPSLSSTTGVVEITWGSRGESKGLFQKPRAITIDKQDLLYVVDMTGRVQVFDRDGQFQRSWHTPTIENGKPSGLEMSNDDLLMVADTHYFQVLFYTRTGKRLPERTIGGVTGNDPGTFNFVTDVVQDSRDNYYISEYGEVDRIQKLSPDREFLYQWGSQGMGKGQFQRPNSLVMGPNDHLWIADSCNHRIKVYDVGLAKPKLVAMWGQHGHAPGKLRFPYDLLLDDEGHLLTVEFGNHRVQKFTLDGEALAVFGTAGRDEGQFTQPWGAALDTRGRLHVLDSYNHRIQRIRI